jgi:hypothetical protein
MAKDKTMDVLKAEVRGTQKWRPMEDLLMFRNAVGYITEQAKTSLYSWYVRRLSSSRSSHLLHDRPEMVEPLEETRSELIFATEPLLSSLHLAIPGSSHGSSLVDLDEVEGSDLQSQDRASAS